MLFLGEAGGRNVPPVLTLPQDSGVVVYSAVCSTVCSVKCTVSSVQCKFCRVNYAVCSAVYSVQCAVYREVRSIVQCAAFRV